MLKAIFTVITKLVPAIILIVNIVEEASDGWTSEEKKAAAMRGVEMVAEMLGFSLSEDAKDVVSNVIDIVVEILNKFGGWKKDVPA